MVDSKYKKSVFDKYKMLSKMNDMVILDVHLCSQANIFPNLAVLPKMVTKSQRWNIKVAQFGRLNLYQMQNF